MSSITVSDIDGTISTDSGSVIEPVVAYLREQATAGDSVFIVSGRSVTRMDETRAWLEANDVPHAAIYLNDFSGTGPNSSQAFKTYKAEKLLAEYEITNWLENDADTRSALRALGIRVTDPATIKSLPDTQITHEPVQDTTTNDTKTHEEAPVQTKTFKAMLDTIQNSDTGAGTVEAVVSVFGNVDYVGDRVMPGAFSKSLEAYAASGKAIPFVWSHDYETPESYIGKVISAEETSEGLRVKAELFDTPRAQVVRELLVNRVVTEFSFAYEIVDQQKAADGINELRQLNILEVGPTLRGANPMTRLIDAKAADAEIPEEVLHGSKAGRTLSGKNEASLQAAADLIAQANTVIQEVLSSVQQASADAEAAKTEDPTASIEEKSDKVEERFKDPQVALALIQLTELG